MQIVIIGLGILFYVGKVLATSQYCIITVTLLLLLLPTLLLEIFKGHEISCMGNIILLSWWVCLNLVEP